MSLTAIVVEGVLQQPVSGAPIDAGRVLYAGAVEAGPVALITDQDGDKVSHWLKVNGFTDHAYYVTRDKADPEDEGERRVLQVTRLMSYVPSVLVIESSPESCRALYVSGIQSLLFLSPVYSKPQYRPDWNGEVTPWDDLVSEVDRTNTLRAKDLRAVELNED